MAIVWRDEMGIDGGVMDADHKCLIALANEVDAAHPALTLQRELQVIVAKLTTYARIHFEREERWQVGAAFLFASAHRKHHIEFGHELEAISGLFRDGLSLQQMLALQAHISEVLHGWIVDHIIKADGSMKPYADQFGGTQRAQPRWPRRCNSARCAGNRKDQPPSASCRRRKTHATGSNTDSGDDPLPGPDVLAPATHEAGAVPSEGFGLPVLATGS